MMKIIHLTSLTEFHKKCIYELWNNEYPQNLRYNDVIDFEAYLDSLAEQKHYLLISEQAIITGWAAVFKRDNEKWFVLIINNQIQGVGYGTLMLDEIKKEESYLVGWAVDHDRYSKINGDKYRSPLAFYIKNHFHILENCRIESGKISAVKIIWKRNDKALLINVIFSLPYHKNHRMNLFLRPLP